MISARSISLFSVLCLSHTISYAEPSMPALFTDGMVLQQGKPIAFWGYAEPGTRVRVALATEHADPIANDDGVWRAFLGPFSAGGPHTLQVRAGAVSHEITGVLIGEVWIYAGDMQSFGAAEKESLSNRQDSVARTFTVAPETSFAPEQNTPDAQWQTISGNGRGQRFARELQSRLDVPVGVINLVYPGAPIEAWVSDDALNALGEWRPIMGMLPQLIKASSEQPANAQQNFSDWHIDLDAFDEGYTGGKPRWAEPAFDDAQWAEIIAPGYWEDQGYPALDGFGWYRKTVTIPPTAAGKPVTLRLAGANDIHRAWFNGVQVGAFEEMNGSFVLPRAYTVPAQAVRSGENTIAVRVYDLGNMGGFVGDPKDLRIEFSDTTLDPVSLAGAWKFKPGMAVGMPTAKPVPPVFVHGNQRIPGVVFNAMLAPLFPYAIRGVVWYHGESNIGRARQYETLLPALINDWRLRFRQGDLPFLIVPLPGDKQPEDRAQLLAAQMRVLSAPNVVMPRNIDTSNGGDYAGQLASIAEEICKRASQK